MKFGVLGPLELTHGGTTVELHGLKQRAALGYMLFHANRVVSTSELLDALWPSGEAPNSARKILHNAVWGLRGVLRPVCGPEHDGDEPSLITRPPGYLFRVDAESVDLHRFRALASEGRARLGRGDPAGAAESLQGALGLWRGAALADLVEAGFHWTELVAAETARLDALEDHFDAALALGRHHRVLPEIEAAIRDGGRRERLCGQLMLAQYRSGRQTDALETYNRQRACLVDELGLEPGQDLQDLQRSILRHDESLSSVAGEPLEIPAARPDPETPPADTVVPDDDAAGESAVVLVHITLDDRAEAGAGLDRLIRSTAGDFRETVEMLGGTVAARVGPTLQARFPFDGDPGRAADRAVSAAVAMLGSPASPGPARPRVTVRAAVACGEVGVVELDPGPPGTATLTGDAVDRCHTLLARTPPGRVAACATTRSRTGDAVTYGTDPSGPEFRVRHTGWGVTSDAALPLLERDLELDVLTALLDRSRQHGLPQFVTLLGDVGVGKTRLVHELVRRAMGRWDDVDVLSAGAGADGGPVALLRQLVFGLCRVTPATSPTARAAAVCTGVAAAVADSAEATAISAVLVDLVANEGDVPQHRVSAIVDAAGALIRATTAERSLVIVVDDGHDLDGASLDILDGLVASPDAPSLTVLVAARPELPRGRPHRDGRGQSATITLAPLPDPSVDRLCDLVVARMRQEAVGPPTPAVADLLGDRDHGVRRRAMRTLMRLDPVRPGPTILESFGWGPSEDTMPPPRDPRGPAVARSIVPL